MDRRKFFKHGLKKLIGVVEKVQEIKEEIPEKVQNLIEPKKDLKKEESEEIPKVVTLRSRTKKFKNLKYPPGAIKEKGKFEKKCTSCGDCIARCPYDVIFPIYEPKLNKSLPYMDLNLKACMMCIDFPCIQSCNHGALKPLKKKETLKLGQAKLLFDYCLNFEYEEENCNSCKVSCPVENVVSIKKGKPKFSESCTGCGICVQSCPTFPKAILIK